jgi:hypothetical protein
LGRRWGNSAHSCSIHPFGESATVVCRLGVRTCGEQEECERGGKESARYPEGGFEGLAHIGSVARAQPRQNSKPSRSVCGLCAGQVFRVNLEIHEIHEMNLAARGHEGLLGGRVRELKESGLYVGGSDAYVFRRVIEEVRNSWANLSGLGGERTRGCRERWP